MPNKFFVLMLVGWQPDQFSHFNQIALVQGCDVSEAKLSVGAREGIGPMFLKLHDRVLYRLVDIEAYEVSCLSISTKRLASVNVAA